MRRRIRLRTTAPPSAFLTLMPNRLAGRPLARKKTTKRAEDFRPPLRYTASNSERRTRRAALEKSCGAPSEVLNGREAMTTLLTARCQNFAPPFGLHSSAEAMGLMAPAHFGLKRAFGQRCSSKQAPIPSPNAPTKGLPSLNPSRLTNKTFSVSDHLRPVKARAGIGDRRLQNRYPPTLGAPSQDAEGGGRRARVRTQKVVRR
jgi:hypothetical protein